MTGVAYRSIILSTLWTGSTNDARVWHMSEVKEYLEAHQDEHFYLLAGDSAYPVSELLVRPFYTAEAVADPNRKGLFNERLSGLRTAMSEDVYGVWKSRFPCLRCLRCHLPLAQDIILATAMLHNMAVRWRAEHFPQEEAPDVPDPDYNEDQLARIAGGANAGGDIRRRLDGARVRNALLVAMPPR